MMDEKEKSLFDINFNLFEKPQEPKPPKPQEPELPVIDIAALRANAIAKTEPQAKTPQAQTPQMAIAQTATLTPFEVPSKLEAYAKRKPISWLIEGLVPAGGKTEIFGGPGTFKTFITLDMAAHIATPGMDRWCGFEVEHGAVIYLAGEGYYDFLLRMRAWEIHHKIDIPDKAFYPVQEALKLNEQNGALRVIDGIKSRNIEPVLIVADTLNIFMAGDENSARDIGSFLDAVDAIKNSFDNCAELIIHHTGKGQEKQDEARGSSALRGRLDSEIKAAPSLVRGRQAATFTQTKSRFGPNVGSVKFEFLEVDSGWTNKKGRPEKSLVAIETKEMDFSKRELTAVQALAKCTAVSDFYDYYQKNSGLLNADHLEEMPDIDGGEWRDKFRAIFEAANPDMKPATKRTAAYKAFNFAVDSLIDKGLIIRTDTEKAGYRLNPKLYHVIANYIAAAEMAAAGKEAEANSKEKNTTEGAGAEMRVIAPQEPQEPEPARLTPKDTVLTEIKALFKPGDWFTASMVAEAAGIEPKAAKPILRELTAGGALDRRVKGKGFEYSITAGAVDQAEPIPADADAPTPGIEPQELAAAIEGEPQRENQQATTDGPEAKSEETTEPQPEPADAPADEQEPAPKKPRRSRSKTPKNEPQRENQQAEAQSEGVKDAP